MAVQRGNLEQRVQPAAGTAATEAVDAAIEALRCTQDQPAKARALALTALAGLGTEADVEAVSVAQEALGLAAKELHDVDQAVVSLKAAVRTAEGGGLLTQAARARVSLAFVLQSAGEPLHALAELDAAAEHLKGDDAARAQMRRGSILQRLGRFDDALDAYQLALPGLRRIGDRLWEARLLSNRGVILTAKAAFAAAERDLQRATELHTALGQRLAAAQTEHNLGYLAARRGDVPTALAWFDRADQAYQQLGLVDYVGLADRCELLLTSRLLGEARRLAERAVAALDASGSASDLAEARLVLASAALLQGDLEQAQAAAEAAEREFTAQERPRWAVLARYAALRAGWRHAERTPAVATWAVTTAEELDAAGWALAAMDARLIATRVSLELDDLPSAERALGATAPVRMRGPVELRARAWHAEALLRIAHGNLRGADAALRAGMRALDRHRAALGSTELRAHVAGYADELASAGMRLAVESRNAWRVLRWAERWRAGSLHLRPVRPPQDPELHAALAALRATMLELDDAALRGHDTRPMLRRQATLEAVVQRHTRREPGDGGGAYEPVPVARLLDALGNTALVELVSHDERLDAVVVVDGCARLRRLGPQAAVLTEVEALRFARRRLARQNATARARAAAEEASRYAAARLQTLLIEPIADLVGDRPIVMVPTGPLHALPWSVLPSCKGRSLVVSPSARLWLRSSTRSATAAHAPGVFIGCTELPHASAEVVALHEQYPGSRLLLGDEATVPAVTAALNGAAVAHVACHGEFRADNPLFSCLRLADGPLTVYDLERLPAAPPLLLLAACDTGLSAVEPGDELMGLSSALFSLGTATLIASVVPVPDAAALPFMLALHDRLRRGEAAGEALAHAQETEGEDVAAAAFVCFGAG